MTEHRRELSDLFTRDSRGKLHLNAKSVLLGGYDPEETGEIVEEINTYYRDIIVNLLRESAQKDEEIARLKAEKN